MVSPVIADGPGTKYQTITWTQIATGGSITEQAIDRLAADIVAQVSGTFGGATVTIQGSVDGTNFANLSDPAGTEISLTAAGLAPIRDQALYIKPAISGGTGDDVDVTILVRYA